MPVRLTIEEVRERVEKEGCRLISTTYESNKKPLEILCSCESPKNMLITYNAFKRGIRCPSCRIDRMKNSRAVALRQRLQDMCMKCGFIRKKENTWNDWPKFLITFTKLLQIKTMFHTLNELIAAIETVFEVENPAEKITTLMPLVEKYIGIDWRRFADPGADFSRALIYRSDVFEVLLLSWKKDHTTPFHSHPSNGCILRVLEGGLIENRKTVDGIIDMYVHGPNSISFMHDDEGIHQIIAAKQTFSLHIYAPPGFYESQRR